MVIFSAVATELPGFPQFPLIVLMLCINSINKIITCLALNKYHPFQLHRAKDSNSFLSSRPKITNGWQKGFNFILISLIQIVNFVAFFSNVFFILIYIAQNH